MLVAPAASTRCEGARGVAAARPGAARHDELAKKRLFRLLQRRRVRLGLGRHVTDVLVITNTLVITNVMVITYALVITDAPPDRAAGGRARGVPGGGCARIRNWSSRLITADHG